MPPWNLLALVRPSKRRDHPNTCRTEFVLSSPHGGTISARAEFLMRTRR
jgi:hypothetical protein